MRQRLSPHQTCKLFMNVRNHFSKEKFDMFSSKSIRYTEESYEKRKDKPFFEKLAYDYASGDLEYYFMSNFLAGANHPSEQTDGNYNEFKARMHKIEYIFNVDCMLIHSYMIKQDLNFNDFFISKTGGLPVAIQMLNGKLINIETICLIDALFNGIIVETMDKQITDDFIWKPIRLRILKYSPWISRYYDPEKIKDILRTYT